MKKITDFIVEKRNIILVTFICLAGISVFLMNKVQINSDISKYLPEDSETRIGMNIMNREFEEQKSSSLYLMFHNLSDKEKTLKELENIEGVSSVDYNETEEYNNEDYTLFILNVEDYDDSKTASDVYEKVKENYKDEEIYTSGSIKDANSSVLSIWIVVLAVVCALVILIIMSPSYVEPFLFLFTILVAVLLNKGSNVIFQSVSNITDSIVAILQMALSMDYSIMLMNRYTQEKLKEKNKVKAMKEALYKSFLSISSSSITTIVGLLALVFMSFTIGRDLGFVLAKGVLLSLVSIFLALPSLILLFDKPIAKTQKKTLNLNLDKLGKYIYKIRYIAAGFIILVFSISYLLKGNLGILYTSSEDDKIESIFKEENQIAIIYQNEEEDKISSYCRNLKKDELEVVCYGNTINEALTYDHLNQKLEDLGSDAKQEDYLLKLIYYHYYNPNENNKISLEELTNFIQNKVLTNTKMSSLVDENIKRSIDKLSYFAKEEEINKKRTEQEIANILGIDQDKVHDIFIYYNSKNTTTTISISDFVHFMNQEVLTNPTFSKNIDESAKANLQKLSNFTNKSTIQTNLDSSQLATVFGMKKEDVDNLLKYYTILQNTNNTLSIHEFASFVSNDLLKDSAYSNYFDNQTKESIQLLLTYSDKDTITKEMNAKELSQILGIEENTVKQILLLNETTKESSTTLTLKEFINNIEFIKNNTNYLEKIEVDSILQLKDLANNENYINQVKLDKNTLNSIFAPISPNLVETVYLTLPLPSDYQMTTEEFINLVLNNLSSYLDKSTLDNLNLIKLVIEESISQNPTRYSANTLANILGKDTKELYPIYALIDYINGNTNDWLLSPYQLVQFLIQNSNNQQLESFLDDTTLSKLTLLNTVMESTINNAKYTSRELSKILNMDMNLMNQIYSLYYYHNNTIKLTRIEFVNFILEHQTDPLIAQNLSKDTLSSLEMISTLMTSVVNRKQYSSLELSNLLSIDEDSLRLIYSLYDLKNSSTEVSLNEITSLLLEDMIKKEEYKDNFDSNTKNMLNNINKVMVNSINNKKYTKEEMSQTLSNLSDELDKDLIELLFIYYGSEEEYQEDWTLTVEEFANYLNDFILKDKRFDNFLDEDMKLNIKNSKKDINDAKKMLVGKNYSRMIINTKLPLESDETFKFIQDIKDNLSKILSNNNEVYVIGDSPMAYEISQTFTSEFNFISILTMIFIFLVVAISFKSILIPLILTLLIQCAVYLTMGILSLMGGEVYFIALLIVQSILMGATIDYAIVYTSYYKESRTTMNVKDSIINAYNKSIHTILTSSSILIIVTLIVGNFASAIAAKICKTLSQGTLCSVLLILLILPAILAASDKFIIRNKNK